MELKEQVCSLELAKKLKQLGVKQESLFYWYQSNFQIGDTSGVKPRYELTQMKYPSRSIEGYSETIPTYSAFGVAELGEMLPEYFCSARAGTAERWICEKFSNGIINAECPRQYADTEANARARMLVYLLKNKLINL